MLNINNLSIQHGSKHLFKDVTARVNPQDRIGLVGVNGTGKSTLLKILAGQIEVDFGVKTFAKKATIGYLPQEITAFPAGQTVYQEAQTAFAGTLARQQELNEVNHAIAALPAGSEALASLLQRQGELQHLLEQDDVFLIQSKIEKVLAGLGFKESDLNKDCLSFSGGWLMRLMLAKHLLSRPDYLLLDEPTNHLDLESLTWLEDFLSNYQGALVIVSHDRAFLDNITTTIWELSLGNLTTYRGNYSKYVVEKEIRLQVQRAAHSNQQARIDQTMRFVKRFRAKSTKAAQVQSRLKQLEKMDIIELEDSEQNISFRFPPAPPSGRQVIEINDLGKEYDEKEVFRGLNFDLSRGDKLAVVGVNGAGKSTMARVLAGEEQADQGKVKLGHNVRLAYFSQHQAQALDPGLTVLETMLQLDTDKTFTQTRSLLGAFLFRDDDVDKKVEVLSGGEKSRLALARIIASPANLMIMDEPTNHLDMTSQEILREALRRFDGSIIIVSHNRYFLDGFVNKVLEIRNNQATLYEGNISYYLDKIKNDEKHAVNLPGANAPGRGETSDSAGGAPRPKGKEARKAGALLRQEKNRVLAPLTKKNSAMEKEIESLESNKTRLEQLLADPELYRQEDEFSKCSREYKHIETSLKRLYREWENIQAQIEEVEAGFKTPLTGE